MQSHGIERPTAVSQYSADSPEPSTPTSSAASLPDPVEYSGDMGLELTALITKMANERKQSGREARAQDEKALDTAERAQVGEMQKKADDLRSEGRYELVAGLLSAAGHAAAGVCELNAADHIATEGAASAAAKNLGGQGTLYAAGGDALAAGFKAQATSARAQQSLDDATIATYDHAASHAKRSADDARDEIRDGSDLGKKALEFYREFSSAQNQAQSAALHRS